jgi:hypothetical protein
VKSCEADSVGDRGRGSHCASVAFASDLQTRDDCLEFHTPHHCVHASLWKKSGKNASANSSVGKKIASDKYQQAQAPAQRAHDEEIARQCEYRKMFEEKEGP